MSEREKEAVRLARRASEAAHLAKNAFHEDVACSRLASAVELLALAVAELAKTDPVLGSATDLTEPALPVRTNGVPKS